MKGNLSACLAVTLTHEGGWSDHPRDPGGATMKGVTLAVFRKYHPGATKADLRAISDADVQRIYSVGYWNPVRGDDLPAGVDLATFDFAVNSGVSRGAKALQAAVGAAQDGAVGPATVARAAKADPVAVVKSICARRLSFVRGLSTWGTFGRGWARRIADVEAKGVKMALVASGAGSASVMAAMQAGADGAQKRADRHGETGGVIGTAGTAVSGAEVLAADVNWLIVGGVALVALALFVALRSRSLIHHERAAAYLENMG